ncbi:MAG: GFA family protein [Pseudomonadota bacterium]
MYQGRCECGAVAFEAPELRREVTFCHCSQCRRTSGHQWAATRAPWASLTFTRDDGLTWYTSSDFAKRGFCKRCGSSLFYRMNDEDGVGIAAGCIDAPNDLTPGKHIFVADKGDYYDIAADAPQLEKY